MGKSAAQMTAKIEHQKLKSCESVSYDMSPSLERREETLKELESGKNVRNAAISTVTTASQELFIVLQVSQVSDETIYLFDASTALTSTLNFNTSSDGFFIDIDHDTIQDSVQINDIHGILWDISCDVTSEYDCNCLMGSLYDGLFILPSKHIDPSDNCSILSIYGFLFDVLTLCIYNVRTPGDYFFDDFG